MVVGVAGMLAAPLLFITSGYSFMQTGHLGDTIGGVTAPISSLVGSILVFLALKGQIIEKAEDILKSPYVLEFLGLDAKAAYTETDLESAIINKIEHFLLEMGKGFLFSGRQVRFTFDGEDFFVDLVLYNRLLQCFVLVDLKIGKLKHQDIGQMQMYVNYYDRYVKQEFENPTIGIVICKDKSDAVVEITLPKDNKTIFAKEYKLYLPSKTELKKLIE